MSSRDASWEGSGAFARVAREVHVKHSRERGAACVRARYVGKGLAREEMLSYEGASDWCEGHRVRRSEDNGKTWSGWEVLHEEWPSRDGFSKEEMPFAWCHDPVSDRALQFTFQRLLVGPGAEAIQTLFQTGEQTIFDHNFWSVSEDDGRTFGEPHQLRYEPGPAFDPGNWAAPDYLRTNEMYGAYNAITTREGTIVYPSAGVPMDIADSRDTETVGGVLCFIGTWDPREGSYSWEISQPISVPHRVSGRGLMEPSIAQLGDGRLLLVMRGSNVVFPPKWEGTVENGGHAWTSLSEDGGRAWSPVADLRYDTGDSFYSPSAFSVLLRHTGTGKLVWLGNIIPEPAKGNLPRYPLYIGEMDETILALKRDTLTVIDDRDIRRDSEEVQFSNFHAFEDRESGQIELYMTRYGERTSHWLHADAYKYTITMR